MFCTRSCVSTSSPLPALIKPDAYRCVIIGIVRFWQIYVIDLIGNLTGTSLTTFMLCSIELMLAGLCINIPMFRPFYIKWREQYKSSRGSHGKASYVTSESGVIAPSQGDTPGHATWVELVSHPFYPNILDMLMLRKRNRKTAMIATAARRENLPWERLMLSMLLKIGRLPRKIKPFERTGHEEEPAGICDLVGAQDDSWFQGNGSREE